MIPKNSPYRAWRHSLLTLCLFLLMSERAAAVGFMINPPSQVTGLANAGSAVYDRSTAAISNNPAAMSLLDGEQVGGNLTAVIQDWDVNEGWDFVKLRTVVQAAVHRNLLSFRRLVMSAP
jgi:long-subunit fatty acid transport protein